MKDEDDGKVRKEKARERKIKGERKGTNSKKEEKNEMEE